MERNNVAHSPSGNHAIARQRSAAVAGGRSGGGGGSDDDDDGSSASPSPDDQPQRCLPDPLSRRALWRALAPPRAPQPPGDKACSPTSTPAYHRHAGHVPHRVHLVVVLLALDQRIVQVAADHRSVADPHLEKSSPLRALDLLSGRRQRPTFLGSVRVLIS